MLSAIARTTQRLQVVNRIPAALGQRHNMIDGERPISAATNTAMIIERTQPNPFGPCVRPTASRKPGAALVLTTFCQVHQVSVKTRVCTLALLAMYALIVGRTLAPIGLLVVNAVVCIAPLFPFGVLKFLTLVLTQTRALLLGKSRIGATAMPRCTLRLKLSLVEIGISAAALTNAGSNAWFALRFALRELRSWFRFAATSTAFCGIMGVHIDLRSMCHSPGDGNRAGASACSYYSIGVR